MAQRLAGEDKSDGPTLETLSLLTYHHRVSILHAPSSAHIAQGELYDIQNITVLL